jgi:hypothetical protein
MLMKTWIPTPLCLFERPRQYPLNATPCCQGFSVYGLVFKSAVAAARVTSVIAFCIFGYLTIGDSSAGVAAKIPRRSMSILEKSGVLQAVYVQCPVQYLNVSLHIIA